MKSIFKNVIQRSSQRFWTLSLPVVLLFFTFVWISISYFVYIQEHNATGANILSFEDSLWWGVVTFLTVGYGDRFPVTAIGRVLGVLLMFGGVLVISLVTARISSVFFEAALKRRRGLVDTSLLKDHFVICGWTDDMEELLLHILDFNQHLTSNQVVVIASVDQNSRDAILAHPRLKDSGFILGEYFTETQLRRAAPERARKVMILADRTPNPGGQVPTPVEIDARTIMTAMSLSNIARGTMVTAEILDPKMAQYLKIAGVSEIIYSREYSRLLIGNASGGTGVVNILYDLLDPTTPSKVSTVSLPLNLIGKSYQEIRSTMEGLNPNILIVGVLENFGNQQSIKEFALRKAQQTPDIYQLVDNLKGVREIKCNHPLFNPSPNYIVNEGALIIAIENRLQGASNVGIRHFNEPKNA